MPRDESGVLDQPDRPGQTDPRLVVGANRVVVEAGNCACPDTSQVGTVVHFAVSTPTRLPPTVDTISRSLAPSHVRCEVETAVSNMAVHSPVHSLCIYPGRLWGGTQ